MSIAAHLRLKTVWILKKWQNRQRAKTGQTFVRSVWKPECLPSGKNVQRFPRRISSLRSQKFTSTSTAAQKTLKAQCLHNPDYFFVILLNSQYWHKKFF